MSIQEEAIKMAFKKHPDCNWADWENGLQALTFAPTCVVNLWRSQECYLAGDPPKYVESYLVGESPFIKEGRREK